ncbi:MAG: RNA helicase [Deltaproteobacteria bacterium GWC2_55_46]|nr:MAG: RNA helicase [Deltaproteobacteria bacterium GWA2_55_82]OGQ63870.1 MAG: RNA helicase [Deltaproteobacteria bacterium RIFCSPLOWO2_02_FULL_55_12]OIJ72666.1 MAG: RNA helicase [Deltaproteobacteria bacterium GWC2_55_46]
MESKEKKGFNDFSLSSEVLKAIGSMGFEEPTPIQAKTIPVLLANKDIIGQAQTGTGKTAAFGIPIVEKIERGLNAVQAIILAPTRELAIQAAEEMNKLGAFKRVHALPVYGGTSIERQIKALAKGVHVVVGTPGRVLDHIERKTLKLKDVKMVVLDEADEMLDMGFVDDITRILKETPDSRQTLLFSATMPEEVLRISKRYMKTPERIRIASDTLTASKIKQIVYEVRNSDKLDALSRLIDFDAEGMFLVFCHTKREVDEVVTHLRLRGYDADAMHGDYTQAQREAVLKKFRASKVDILVATDVAARGLDISNISHVVNYSIPQNPESYVHRIGRTGRAGREGIAITFVTPREDRQLRQIQAASKAVIKRGKLPSREEVMGARITSLEEKINVFIDDKGFNKFLALAERLSEKIKPVEALAALLKFQFEGFEKPSAEQPEAVSLDDTGASPGMARLFLTIGKEQGVSQADIITAISKKADLPRQQIKKVSIFDTFTFVEVPRNTAEKVIEYLHRSIISGRKVAVAPAKPKAFGR